MPSAHFFVLLTLAGSAAMADAAALTNLAQLRCPTPLKETFVYKRVDGRDMTLDVYPSGSRFPTSALPALVFIHGGGWGSGSTDHFAAHCRYFASRGLVSINVAYRLTQGYFPDRPGVSLFDCIADAQDAVRWVRAHARELGVDPQRIAAAGDSAGGHLTAATALLPDPRTDRPDPAAAPDALVLCNPVLDLAALGWPGNLPGLRDTAGEAHTNALRRASPMLNIRPGLPPTLVLHGTADKVVPAEQAERFHAGMRAAGNRCELILYPEVDHAFVLLDYYKDETVVARAIVDIDRFLGSLGYLQGPPTLVVPTPEKGAP